MYGFADGYPERIAWISYGDPLGVNLDKLDIHSGYPFGYPLWISNISKFTPGGSPWDIHSYPFWITIGKSIHIRC